jgi:hypothetical protein
MSGFVPQAGIIRRRLATVRVHTVKSLAEPLLKERDPTVHARD